MNMDKIYELMLKGYELTKDTLLANGYTNDTINQLMKKEHMKKSNMEKSIIC